MNAPASQAPPPLVIRDARVLTLAGPAPRRGPAARDLGTLDHADVELRGGLVAAVRLPGESPPRDARVIDARGRVLMPAFIDCHTHACWAGGFSQRADEWERRRRGETYQQILAAGGGIMSTVRAVRAATDDALASELRDRLARFLDAGTTSVEIKSGYGLSTTHELRMLRVIRDAASTWPGTIVPSALLGHAIDPAFAGVSPETGAHFASFEDYTRVETLPAVSREFPGIAVDAYCERGAWGVEACAALLDAAGAAGHPVRVHADQFNSLGMVARAARLGARSVDHLEATDRASARALADAGVFGVILPCCGVALDGRFADGRMLIDEGVPLAIATNCNPGSAPTLSMPAAIFAAVRHAGLTWAEAITAATRNPAVLLGLPDRGAIAPGLRADLILLHERDERALAFEQGGDPVACVIGAGRVVRGA